jgi:hypothetical protein
MPRRLGDPTPRVQIITKDAFDDKYRATHYSISPSFTMPKTHPFL